MPIPVSLQDAKRQLRVDDNEQDDEIQGFIKDAAAWIEEYTGHILVARDVVEQFDNFGRLRLRAWPIKPNATVGIGYTPNTGAATNLYGARIVSTSHRPALVSPAAGSRWPSAATGVTVLVRAGYEDDDAVPGNFRRAMLVLIGAYDADREGGEVLQAAEATARKLCRYFRLRQL
ncbi:head-tail connector protein [Sphingomonas faeni]|uniref:head-tail connector protein n=1 Tax=Sphingomonas faeni TaxID=185950 RepID=UPI00335EB326